VSRSLTVPGGPRQEADLASSSFHDVRTQLRAT